MNKIEESFMTNLKFIQIHSLHGYSAVLLNRDDSGLAKRLKYGGRLRTRISSQCLKRHWRMANDESNLKNISEVTAASRSREIVTRRVIDPLRKDYEENLIESIDKEFQRSVYGSKGESKSGRQPLLLGEPEIKYLADEAKKIAKRLAGKDQEIFGTTLKEWSKQYKNNMKQLRETCKLPGGLVSALFGRMVTSDPEANIDAAIHVAHAFTIHEEESESDYFSVVDDLQRIEEESGADHLGETELTSGIFYGYVVVDRDILLDNLGQDEKMACEVVRRLVHLIAKVTPGAKLGSTAPYGYASWMLIEAGCHQPRSLAEAFREPRKPEIDDGENALDEHLKKLDESYGCNEIRRFMSLTNSPIQNAKKLTLPELAEWTGRTIQTGKI